MWEFLAKHQYLAIWIVSLVIIGALSVLLFQLNSVFLPSGVDVGAGTNSLAAISSPTTPQAPSISLVIQKDGVRNTLVIRWANLPASTAILNIFRSKSSSPTSTWTFWKSLTVSQDELMSGNASIDLGEQDTGYSYYIQAAAGNGMNGDATSTIQILWTSAPTVPEETSPPQNPASNPGNNGDQNNGTQNATSGEPLSSSTAEPNPPPPNNQNNGTSTNNPPLTTASSGSPDSGSGPSGNPYYNPQIQVAGYGSTHGSFWVRHVNQSIEIGWQNLPSSTDIIIVSRSENSEGPWNQILEQDNPGATGSYSLQIVDETLGDPYYYELSALYGSTTLAVYGPAYLPPH